MTTWIMVLVPCLLAVGALTWTIIRLVRQQRAEKLKQLRQQRV